MTQVPQSSNNNDKAKEIHSGESLKFFPENSIRQARKLIMLSRLSISYIKETEKYLIVSGIIKDNRPHEAKIVFRPEATTPLERLSTKCDCEIWTVESHCPHTAALFIQFFINKSSQQELNPNDINGRSYVDSIYHGLDHGGDFLISNGTESKSRFFIGNVTPNEFGTIVNGPHKLDSAPPSATYSTLQYVLTDKKLISFPVPKNLTGKIIINFQFVSLENNPNGIRLPKFHFSHETESGREEIHISIFENLYLFNWRTGESFHIPDAGKEIISKIRNLFHDLSLNHFIWLSSLSGFDNYFQLRFEGKNVNEIEPVSVNPIFSISPFDKGMLQFSLDFINAKQSKYTPPEFFRQLCFDNGLLEHFKKKKDAYFFLQYLFNLFSNNEFSNFKSHAPDRFKNDWQLYLYYLKQSPLHLEFDHKNNCFVSMDKNIIVDLYKSLITCFQDAIFRFSHFSQTEFNINYTIQSGIAFQGLRAFIEHCQINGINVLYDRKEIGRWNSRIRFERRASTTRWFDLDVTLSEADFEIIKSVDKESGIVMTSEGMIMLGKEEMGMVKMLEKMASESKSPKKMGENSDGMPDYKFSIPYSRTRIIEIFELKKMGFQGILTTEEEELCNKLLNLKEMPQYPIPQEFSTTLRPYQREGYNWLRFLFEHQLGACLADDMGLGKTLQVITLLKSIENNIEKVLIVCPVTILINWQKEFEKFSDMKTFIYHGGQRELPKDVKFVITSYGIMKKEVETTFKDLNFDVLILDEVQHLKNMRSLGAWSARKINSKFKICLTGTPVENDLAEFYNIIDLAVPGIWGDLQMVRTISSESTRERARKVASPFILRRTKSQVLTDLPPKIENNIFLPFTEEERALYLNTLLEIRRRIDGAVSKKKYGEILRGLLRLRQTCLWQTPNLGAGSVPKNYNEIISTKIQFLLDQLEQILEEGHKVLVFSQFTTYLDIVQFFLREKHYHVSRIDGGQQFHTRQKEIDNFQDGKSQVFLISLKAGGVGLNLTAASYVFLMDPWWNPAVESQAIDRAHRIGQKNTLTVYRPIIKDSVEEKVIKLQETKRQLFMDLLPEDDEKIFSGRLTMEDFLQLFS